MKKTRGIRFNTMVDVYEEFPIPLVYKDDSDEIESATDKEDSNVTKPATVEEKSNVTEPEVVEEKSNVSEPEKKEEKTDVSEPATDKEDSNVSELTMDEEESNVTEPEMEIESNVTEPATDTESNETEPAMDTDINVTEPAIFKEFNVTESALHIDSNVTESAINTDSSVTEPAIHTDSYVSEPARNRCSYLTKPATAKTRKESTIVFIDSRATDREKKTEDDYLNEMALDIAETAIAAAIDIVEEDDDYTIKNMKWLTHGEFTPERCRKQIEEFVMTWEYDDRWVHYTKLVETRDLIHSFHYIYSVRWSVPTCQIPTAYSSAFAFFKVKFNKNKPPDAPIEISYKFEGQSLIHRPGMTRFRENWVKEMVVAKHNIMKSFPF